MAETEPKPREPFLREITLRNILSFGPDTPPFALKNLNVLIGPNGSGKSNFIDCIDLLRSTATDFRRAVRDGGGSSEWLWKRGKRGAKGAIEATATFFLQTLRHELTLYYFDPALEIDSERIAIYPKKVPAEGKDLLFHMNGNLHLGKQLVTDAEALAIANRFTSNHLRESLLLIEGYEIGKEASSLAYRYRLTRIYRSWCTGRDSEIRSSVRADEPADYMAENFSNWPLILAKLRQNPHSKKRFMDAMRDLYEGVTDVDISIAHGMIAAVIEEGDIRIPMTRMSDGTIRFICLLLLLLDPDPPPLICLEEPEVGLHPDLIGKVADLLVDASTRTQLIVTTHSDILIDALSDHADSVVVCEKEAGATTMTRLDSERLQPWLERYRLGQLWTKGELGGTRW